MTKSIDREAVIRALLNDDDERIEMYHYDAEFHAKVETMVMFMEVTVDGFEASARTRHHHPVHLHTLPPLPPGTLKAFEERTEL